MTRETCWTSIPRARRSVAMRTREDPDRNSFMMTSRSDCCISPSVESEPKRRKEKLSSRGRRDETGRKRRDSRIAETVNSLAVSFSVSQSTFLLVLQKMTAWVMVTVS